MIYLLWFLLLAVVNASFCPSECKCKPEEGIVRCEDFTKSHGFSISHFPSNITVLHLKGFTFDSLSDLPPLESLASLFVSHGSIEYIPETFLDSFPSLRHLSLGYNELRAIHAIARKPSQLEILELRHNKISFVSSSAFIALPSLRTLDLSFNKLRSLSTAIRARAPQLEHLRLHDNPLHCDCRLKPFVGIISSHAGKETLCQTPKHMHGRDVASLTPDDFACYPAHLVHNVSSSKHLHCPHAESTIWLYKGNEVDRSLTVLDNGNLEIPRDADETDFTCATDKEYSIVSRIRRNVGSCEAQGTRFTHGQTWIRHLCITCTCECGTVSCKRPPGCETGNSKEAVQPFGNN